MVFENTYNYYKKKYSIILEGTVNNIRPLIQDKILYKSFDNKKYNQLTDEDKNQLNNYLNSVVDNIQVIVDDVSLGNKQYQSWLYDMLRLYINDEFFDKFLNDVNYSSKIKSFFEQFQKIIKSPFVKKEERDIRHYDTLLEFINFVKLNEHKLIKYNKIQFDIIFKDSKYDIYAIYNKDKEQFQQLYGPNGYNCGWCVTHNENDWFEQYLTDNDNYYCLWTYKGTNKPFALLHFGSYQFKDIHNNPIDIKYFNGYDIIDTIYTLFKKQLKTTNQHLIKDAIKQFITPRSDLSEYFLHIFLDISNNDKVSLFQVIDPHCEITNNGISTDISLSTKMLHYFVTDNKLTIKFNECMNFDCSSLSLSTLENCPNDVFTSFDCSDNNITNLIGCPKNAETIYIEGCQSLKSLEGVQFSEFTNIYINNCEQLCVIDFIPKNVSKYISIQNCPNLKDVSKLSKFVQRGCNVYIDDVNITDEEIDEQLERLS